MPALHEQSVKDMKQFSTLVAFNGGELRVNEDVNQSVSGAGPVEQVVELEDMTNEQKRIVAAGQTISGSIPAGLTRDQLSEWFDAHFPTK